MLKMNKLYKVMTVVAGVNVAISLVMGDWYEMAAWLCMAAVSIVAASDQKSE